MKKEKTFKHHTNRHHVYPTSRFILKKNSVLHTAWHDIFGNRTPEEAMDAVKKWTTKSGGLRRGVLESERKIEAWKMVFGGLDTPLEEVLKIIEKEWTFPGVRMIKVEREQNSLLFLEI